MADERVIWERVKSEAVNQIHMYKDGLVIAQEMLKLADSKLSLISGQNAAKTR